MRVYELWINPSGDWTSSFSLEARFKTHEAREQYKIEYRTTHNYTPVWQNRDVDYIFEDDK